MSLIVSDHDDLQIIMPAAAVPPLKSCAYFLLANSNLKPNREEESGKFGFSLAKLIHYKSTKVESYKTGGSRKCSSRLVKWKKLQNHNIPSHVNLTSVTHF